MPHTDVRHKGQAELRNTCDAKKNTLRYKIRNNKKYSSQKKYLRNYVGKTYFIKLLDNIRENTATKTSFFFFKKLHICIR